ncbi:hypothetical protein [Agrococcus sp. DT81.2]|uniref:hypothetical protein n=1 Tax=Agrococcus sp. DT81.2 TaxID=3393414 RepID=UPI003CE599A7
MPHLTLGPSGVTFRLPDDFNAETLRQSVMTARLVRIPMHEDEATTELWLNAGTAPWWTISE